MIALGASSVRARFTSFENPRLVGRRFLLIVQAGRKLVSVGRLDLTLGDPVNLAAEAFLYVIGPLAEKLLERPVVDRPLLQG